MFAGIHMMKGKRKEWDQRRKRGRKGRKRENKVLYGTYLGKNIISERGEGENMIFFENIHLCLFVVVCISLGLSIYKLIAPMYKKP